MLALAILATAATLWGVLFAFAFTLSEDARQSAAIASFMVGTIAVLSGAALGLTWERALA